MSHEDLGDQLGALARASQGEVNEEEAPPARQPAAQRPAAPSPAGAPAGKPLAHDEHQDDEDEYIAAEVDDESGGEVAEVPIHFHAPAGQPAYRPLPRKTKKNSELKAIAAPILMTVGVMLLIPAFWSVLVLTGAGVPMSDREDASKMAKVMLLCWPLALTLVIPAVFMFVQLSAEKKRK